MVTNSFTYSGLKVNRRITVPNSGGEDFARTIGGTVVDRHDFAGEAVGQGSREGAVDGRGEELFFVIDRYKNREQSLVGQPVIVPRLPGVLWWWDALVSPGSKIRYG